MANGLRFTTARDLFAANSSAAGDMTAIPTDQPSLEFCRLLLAGRTPEEAITFCAYLLPDRAAIWWGHECLGHLTELLEEKDLALLALVQDWVSEPHNPGRHAAVDEAATPQQRTPAGWIALAVSWHVNGSAGDRANGSIPRPLSAAHAVNAGILAGLARVALADRFSVLTAFVEMGIQLAEIEALRRA
ncbi:hypothetical protein LHFGNBLO_005636 [Mesorhizobium sp. AR10]|uniref:DUF6931 family protein n=1 Tax=Mesorhizobium sp. AR10 TaxID=2865839 RepID=UPI002160A666|nr:hypothetical protein [Mesorhizobium sp. AR10]UVK38470.1 hypothetical protein LHFGNBLO_005636 [Mesorhizobium sp. AR10]